MSCQRVELRDERLAQCPMEILNDIRVRAAGHHVNPKEVLSQTHNTQQPAQLPSERQPIANSPLGDETKTARVRSLISGPTHHQLDAQCSDWTTSRIRPSTYHGPALRPCCGSCLPVPTDRWAGGVPSFFPTCRLAKLSMRTCHLERNSKFPPPSQHEFLAIQSVSIDRIPSYQ